MWLDSLDLSQVRQGWGKPQVNRSIRETPMAVGGVKFERGLGTHAVSTIWIELNEGVTRFTAQVGLDDAAGKGSIVFKVVADGQNRFDSGIMKAGAKPRAVDLDLTGVKLLLLQVLDGGDGIENDHADWAEAKFEVAGAAPRIVAGPKDEAVILTPKATAEPRINGPKVYGCRPGNPFLYRIPAQGDRPMKFTAKNLPKGLTLDRENGVIAGQAPMAGEYEVTLRARNEFGESTRTFRIVAGRQVGAHAADGLEPLVCAL